ncbi:MAG: arsenate reductase ArsC [Verrucomicrobiales bacterium]|jgi:arsenate reductase|nr:arsenate reductase ArsC [Verrucomicrobiales bacterium]
MTTNKTHPYKILFLCTGNSGRSILAEFLLRQSAGDKFEVYSAGANPTGKVNPIILWVLDEVFNIEAASARSKSWTEFQDFTFDFVITLCDRARESCPVWRGQPIIAHWGFEDPANFIGDEEQKQQAVTKIAFEIKRRIDLFIALPFEKLENIRLAYAVQELGRNDL